MDNEKIDFISHVSLFMLGFGFSPDVADFIGCQFAIESNFGKSDLAIKQCNYCGMKFPRVRITSSYGESPFNGFALYTCMDSCLLDYVLCIQYHQPLRKEIEDLCLFKGFIRFYCPERDYITKITNLFNLYQNVKTK